MKIPSGLRRTGAVAAAVAVALTAAGCATGQSQRGLVIGKSTTTTEALPRPRRPDAHGPDDPPADRLARRLLRADRVRGLPEDRRRAGRRERPRRQEDERQVLRRKLPARLVRHERRRGTGLLAGPP